MESATTGTRLYEIRQPGSEQVTGPLSSQELEAMVASGTVTPGTFLREVSTQRWHAARDSRLKFEARQVTELQTEERLAGDVAMGLHDDPNLYWIHSGGALLVGILFIMLAGVTDYVWLALLGAVPGAVGAIGLAAATATALARGMFENTTAGFRHGLGLWAGAVVMNVVIAVAAFAIAPASMQALQVRSARGGADITNLLVGTVLTLVNLVGVSLLARWIYTIRFRQALLVSVAHAVVLIMAPFSILVCGRLAMLGISSLARMLE